MSTRLETLLDDAAFYADQLDRVGSVLVELIWTKFPHRHFLQETAEVYRFLTMDLVQIFSLIKREYRGHSLGARASGPSFEALERFFIIYRDAAEIAAARAGKVAGSKVKEAKKARATAETLISLAEQAAKMLVAEAERLGKWTVEWEQEMGLRRWLR